MNPLWIRLTRGPAAAALLRRFGIDPTRFWLLMDLFRELSERREMFGQLGRNTLQLKGAAYLYFAMMGFLAVMLLFVAPGARVYFWIFQSISALLVFFVLLPETGNSLVNPVEALVLAHQPINGATYNAAKLSHLLRIVLFLVPGINGVACIAGVFLKGASLWYPLIHLGVALVVGVVVALACCAIFGWLIRFVPAARLKSFSVIFESLPLLLIVIPKRELVGVVHVAPEYRMPLAAALGAIAIIGLVVGIRALSGDYLIRVASIVSGQSSKRARVRASRLGALAARWCGGQPARAGFVYSKLLARRDWQFKRQLILALPLLMVFGGLVYQSLDKSPFTEWLAPAHGIPHVYALPCLLLWLGLPNGTHYKASWVFLTIPTGVFEAFARGVHALFWGLVVLTPHALLLPVLMYWWGVWDGLLFIAYSVSMASLYLGLTLRLARGVPFSRPAETIGTDVLMPLMIVGGVVIAAVVLLQMALFESRAMVIAATFLAAAGAFFATRGSLRAFTGSIHYQLAQLSTEAKQFYTEVDV